MTVKREVSHCLGAREGMLTRRQNLAGKELVPGCSGDSAPSALYDLQRGERGRMGWEPDSVCWRVERGLRCSGNRGSSVRSPRGGGKALCLRLYSSGHVTPPLESTGVPKTGLDRDPCARHTCVAPLKSQKKTQERKREKGTLLIFPFRSGSYGSCPFKFK